VTIPVNFGSGDMKALGTYFYARKIWDDKSDKLTSVVGGGTKIINAGAFHTLLVSFIGNRQESFILDTAPGETEWNYPVVGYKMTVDRSTGIVSPGVDPRAVKEVHVFADVHMMGTADPSQHAFGKNAYSYIFTKRYEYRIEMTAYNQIVGGTWLGSNRPDFIWKPKAAIAFDGDYKVLERFWIDATER
jgi:hypothetical protein